MKLVKVEKDGRVAEGVVVGDAVRVIGDWRVGPADAAPFTLGGRPADEVRALADASGETAPLSEVTLAVPIDPLAQIFCAGFNYHAHLTEISSDVPQHPVIFKRTLDTLVAHGQPIIRPRVSETLDYEAEIAVVIGREGRHIAAADAMAHVSGYTCFMDGSVRAWQKHSVTSGKNFWRTGAMGPWIVTPDAMPANPSVAAYVDGEQRQRSTADHMIFGIPELIAYCSTLTRLRPGDVIATGTPGGVGSRMDPPSWLRAGQVVAVEVEGVGRLENRVEDEAS